MGDISATATITKVITATATITTSISATATIDTGVSVSALDTDVIRFRDAASITDNTILNALDVLVTELKDKNIWEKLAVVYPLVGGTASNHSYNLVNPNTFQVTWVNSPTHSSTGVDYNGTTQYGRTGFAVPPSPFHIGVYIRENVQDSSDDDMGSREGASQNNNFINTRIAADSVNGGINSAGTSFGGSTITDSRGFTLLNNVIGATITAYKNGVSLGSASLTTGNSTLEMYLGGRNLDGSLFRPSTREAAFYTMGYDLTATEQLDYYNAVQTFQTSLSRNV